MRDGVRLFTAVYAPKDRSQSYPILLLRTPYSVRPYGENEYKTMLGPGWHFTREKFIFVYQDVRGCFMSGGQFVNMTPHRSVRNDRSDIDESTDTYDTVDWLLANIPNHNGRVGQWGISYPGFYTAAGMIDAHPGLVAVSPQAPIADWWFDDFHHHGAFFLPHTFGFFATFGKERKQPTTQWGKRFDYKTPDGYQFYLDLGPLRNIEKEYFKGEIPFWTQAATHPNYDEFWQDMNILPHLKNVRPAVLTVGGWFDAEDLYGPLKIYQEVERHNPATENKLVMGPWVHGGWGRTDGDKLGHVSFGEKSAIFYREHIELPFFLHHLKGGPDPGLPEAYVFETGANQWRKFDQWPPPVETRRLYFHAAGRLAFDPPQDSSVVYDEFISDPQKPVPFTTAITTGMNEEYMIEDQRFAARRPDVLAYQTDVFEEDLTIAGPLTAELVVATSGTDSDWIVKVIDVFPAEMEDPENLPKGVRMGGYQMMVRGEVFRGRFRNGYQFPEPFVPDEPTKVTFELWDVLHTFKKGHRVMIQVQSSWFPLVDRNPQNFVENIFEADESDFVKATHRVFRSADRSSSVRVGVLPAKSN